MPRLLPLVLLALCACHAHERALVAAGAHCPDIQLSAAATSEPLAAPHVVTGSEAAAGSAMLGLGSLANLFGATAPVTLMTPAGTVQTETTAWRQYEGCGYSAVCFDAGYCSPVEGPRLQPIVHAVPALIERSLRDKAKAFPGCTQAPVAGRRGPLVWSLHACGQTLGCFVTKVSEYDCLGEDKR